MTEPEPSFGAAPNMTRVQLDSHAFLHCPVYNLGEHQISWVRRRDWHILTLGHERFTSDGRVQVNYNEEDRDWVLQIKFVQDRDTGIYECQVSTFKGQIRSQQVDLKVVTPEALILGKEEYHINEGSDISLVCIIENSLEAPKYVFWYQNEKMINYDISNEISVQTTVGKKTSSRLNIKRARPKHSGNYTCKPASAIPASIQVFVLGDKTRSLMSSQAGLSNESVRTLVIAFLAASFVLEFL